MFIWFQFKDQFDDFGWNKSLHFTFHDIFLDTFVSNISLFKLNWVDIVRDVLKWTLKGSTETINHCYLTCSDYIQIRVLKSIDHSALFSPYIMLIWLHYLLKFSTFFNFNNYRVNCYHPTLTESTSRSQRGCSSELSAAATLFLSVACNPVHLIHLLAARKFNRGGPTAVTVFLQHKYGKIYARLILWRPRSQFPAVEA